MRTPTDKPIPFGQRHRTRSKTPVLVYDYDRMVIQDAILPAYLVFQPWEGIGAGSGTKIPITLGEGASAFDWGLAAGKSYFLRFHDFLSHCELAETTGLGTALEKASEAWRAVWSGDTRDAVADDGNQRLLPASELFDVDNQGRTRLFYAAQKGNKEQVERMIYRLPGTGFYPQRLGLIEVKDQEGMTAADLAEQSGQEEIANLLRYQAWHMEHFG